MVKFVELVELVELGKKEKSLSEASHKEILENKIRKVLG